MIRGGGAGVSRHGVRAGYLRAARRLRTIRRVKRALALVLVAAVPALAQPTQPASGGRHRGSRGAPRPATGSGAPATTGTSANGPQRTTITSQDAPIRPPPDAHKEGEYGGVTPGQGQSKDTRPRHTPSKGTLSWLGFEVKDGTSVIFLQSPGTFDVAQHLEGTTLVVNLSGVTRLGQNVWRPVDTRFFDTSLARVAARAVGAAGATKAAPAHGAGVEVRVAFKNAKDAREGTLRTSTEADGMFYAYLSFAGSIATPSAKDPEQ